MQQRKNLSEILAGFAPAPADEEAQRLIARWTKYERARDDLFPVNLGDELSVVAVRRPTDGALAIVLRSLEERIELEGGKTFNVYAIDGLLPVNSVDEAETVLREIRSAYEDRVMADVEGFGGADPDALEEPATW